MNKLALENWVEAYIQAQEMGGVDGSHPLWWAVDKFMEKIQSDPEQAWEAIIGISQRQPSERVIGMLASGPLEDLINNHGNIFIDRIEQVASVDPFFRQMLEHVWESGTPEIWQRLQIVKKGGG